MFEVVKELKEIGYKEWPFFLMIAWMDDRSHNRLGRVYSWARRKNWEYYYSKQ